MDKYNVVKEWKEQFPILSRYTPSTLYMKVDVILIGLRIEGVNLGSYRVILEGIPLWGNDNLKKKIPILYVELVSEKRRQIFIGYKRHNYLFPRALECVKKQFGNVLKENILLSDLYDVLNSSYIPKDSNYHLFELTKYFEFKLALALYLNDTDLMNKTKKEIEKTAKIRK
ncbi:MAG: hypothetical protein ACRCSQ_08380, partial [Bacteroidales bacterium]